MKTLTERLQKEARGYSYVKGWEIEKDKLIVEITPQELNVLIAHLDSLQAEQK